MLARPEKYWTIPRLFDGESVVVIGGGPSVTAAAVRQIAMARLAGRVRTVVINDAVYLAWWADWLHGCDGKWWRYHPGAARFVGTKTTLDATVSPALIGAGLLRATGQSGFDPDPSSVRTGSNGGYQVLHSMIHAGAKRIGLVGFDMRGERWFGGHPAEIMRIEVDRERIMIPHFPSLLPALAEHRVEVVNCTPKSALRTFPHQPLEEFLAL